MRGLNTEVLRLRGVLYTANATEQAQARSQAAPVFAARQSLLESLMASQPGTALQLAFPAEVLADLSAAFPQSAGQLESRGVWQGQLYYYVEDGVGGSSHKENRKIKIGNQLIDLYSAAPVVAGSKCNDVIAAAGVKSNNRIVAESSTLISSGATVSCTPAGAQRIAVILVNLPGYPMPSGVTQQFLKGVFLGNAFGAQDPTDRSISDFWTQNSDGKTWINSSGTGALTVLGPYDLAQNYSYCTNTNGSYSDNSAAVRQAAYAAADSALNYGDFSRVVVVLPNNGSCSPIAGVGTIGCWGSECPGDGACNYSWTWWRADQIGSRNAGVELGTHEMGHNLGMGHAGSRYHSTGVVGPVGAAGTRVEYGDLFGTMGNWNYGFYNAQHALNQTGWLTSANVQTVTANGAYTVQGYDARPAGVKALKIQRGTGNTTSWLYLAFYPNSGIYLGALGSQVHSGAIIHLQDAATPGGKTDLLDFTQTSPNNFSDPALAVGQTFVDPYTDLAITVNSIVDNSLNVTVNYNTPPCTAAPPTVSLSPATGSVNAGSPFSFTVSVKNNDSIACASRNFSLSSTAISGWGSTLSPGSLTLGPSATGTSTLTKTPPADALGPYTVDASTAGVSASATLTVLTPPPAAPAAPSNLTANAVYTGSGKNKKFVQLNLAWVDRSTNETQFRLERCLATGKGANQTCIYGPLAVLGAGVTTYVDKPAAGTYRYHVRSENAVGNSAWIEVQAQVQ
jgi:M6 family metalloprotease-like protein